MNPSNIEPTPQQPQILLQLRQKVQVLRKTQNQYKQVNKKYAHYFAQSSSQLDVILKQKQLQQRKSKSLSLLVNDIQRQIDDYYVQDNINEDQNILATENRILRQILVKLAQKIKDDQKILSFLRQASSNKSKSHQFIQRSKYLEDQTQLLAKFKSQILSFQNPNFQCFRKWNQLDRQSQRLQSEQSVFKIQSQRIKTQLRQHYQSYLESLNRSKASLVNFNQTQRERIITQHLIQQVAFLQQKRLIIQEQQKNLKHHQQILLQENLRIQMQNKELKSFFIGSNNEEQKLATKMKMRIEELRDSLIQIQKASTIPQLPLQNIADNVRNHLKSIEETQNYIQKKIKDEEAGKITLDQKNIIDFFQGILRGRDERIQISHEKQFATNQKLKEISIRKELLLNQIGNLQQGLNYYHYQNASMRINKSIQNKNTDYIISSMKGQIANNNVSKWKERKLNETNFNTTISKYIAN